MCFRKIAEIVNRVAGFRAGRVAVSPGLGSIEGTGGTSGSKPNGPTRCRVELFTFPEQLPGPARFGKGSFMRPAVAGVLDKLSEVVFRVPLDTARLKQFEQKWINPFVDAVNQLVTSCVESDLSTKRATAFVGFTEDNFIGVAGSKSDLIPDLGFELRFEIAEGGTDIAVVRGTSWWTITLTGSVEKSLDALKTVLIWLVAGPTPELTWKARVTDVDALANAFQSKYGAEAIERLWEFLHRYGCTVDTPGLPPRSEHDLKRVVWHSGKTTDYSPVLSDYLLHAYRESLKASQATLQSQEALDILGAGVSHSSRTDASADGAKHAKPDGPDPAQMLLVLAGHEFGPFTPTQFDVIQVMWENRGSTWSESNAFFTFHQKWGWSQTDGGPFGRHQTTIQSVFERKGFGLPWKRGRGAFVWCGLVPPKAKPSTKPKVSRSKKR